MNNYRDLLNVRAGAELLKEIKKSINKELVFGSERFTLSIEALTHQRVTARKSGRPRQRNIGEASLLL
ncbi:hypothetical protein [Nitrosococcus oceani]|uniref:hypothetical protein n=1 Tax=Nitrosococcus oceani TaxID=1229 RepID=UPI0012DFFA6C|nr:hypothetical protein [Nitrosococcus oceani]